MDKKINKYVGRWMRGKKEQEEREITHIYPRKYVTGVYQSIKPKSVCYKDVNKKHKKLLHLQCLIVVQFSQRGSENCSLRSVVHNKKWHLQKNKHTVYFLDKKLYQNTRIF